MSQKQWTLSKHSGAGLKDDFIYYMSFDDYKTLPDPFARTPFTVKEVQETIRRYPNPEKPGELFQWDIHGRLFTPAKHSIPDMAVVMIHGGAANEYEFIFTPDGPEEYPDLTKTDPDGSPRRRRPAYCFARYSRAGDLAARPLQPQTLAADRRNGARNLSSAKSPATRSSKIASPFTLSHVHGSDQNAGRKEACRIDLHVGPLHRRRIFLSDGTVRS